MPAVQKVKLLPELPKIRGWDASPADTALTFSRKQWLLAPHLDLLSNIIAKGVIKGGLRLLVSMPPRFGKSELVSHWTPVWTLANWPKNRVMLASYEATFAASWGRLVRNTMQENPAIGVQLAEDSQAVSQWTTKQGGGMVTAGVGGPLTGRGADLLIIDDYLTYQRVTIEAIHGRDTDADKQEFREVSALGVFDAALTRAGLLLEEEAARGTSSLAAIGVARTRFCNAHFAVTGTVIESTVDVLARKQQAEKCLRGCR